MNGNVRRNAKTAFVCVLFIIIVSLFFYLLTAGTMPESVDIPSADKIADVDLSKQGVGIDISSGEYYTGRLYTPDDFAKGNISQGDPDDKYATFRIVLPLEKGVTYGLSGETATYAQQVYIDGKLFSEVGKVSDNAEEFVPATDRYTLYFTAQADTAEIIIRHAWFNHRTGTIQKLCLAKAPLISANERAQTVCDGLIAGTLLAMAIFFFGMFLLGNRKRSMMWFSLTCLTAALHYLIYESKQIGVLFPYLDWYTEHKLEYITNILYFVFILLYAFAALGLRPHKRFVVTSMCDIAVLHLYAVNRLYAFYRCCRRCYGGISDSFFCIYLCYGGKTQAYGLHRQHYSMLNRCTYHSRLFDRRAYLLHEDILYPLLCDYIVRVLQCGHAYYKSVQNRAPP